MNRSALRAPAILHKHSQSAHFSYEKWLLVHVCAGIKDKKSPASKLALIFSP